LVTAFNGSIYEGVFTDICSLFPSPNFPIMVVPTQHGFRSLSAVAFQACLPLHGLKRVHIQAVSLCWAKVYQPGSFILFAN